MEPKDEPNNNDLSHLLRLVERLERQLTTTELELREKSERLAEAEASLSELREQSTRQTTSTHDQIEAERTLESWKSAAQAEFEAACAATAQEVVAHAMARLPASALTEATTNLIPLPTEEMKGRLIGREGRNIRAFEQIAGVDLIIDDIPNAVMISCFDPIRREVARIALVNLMADGRIHPGRIEELVDQAQTELTRVTAEKGAAAANRAQVADLPSAVLDMMGRLHFRQSYGQNVLEHSVEVATLAGLIADELKLDSTAARRAAFLHDIGKALGSERVGPHALAGATFLREHGIEPEVTQAVAAHHREVEPKSPIDDLVILVDTISATRPGARRESLEQYVNRVKAFEELVETIPGVNRCFALRAGRELRIVVDSSQVDDAALPNLTAEIVAKLEAEMDSSTSIKVTLIREVRAVGTAF